MAPTVYDPNSPDEQAVPLPSAPIVEIKPNVVLQPPLSRRGHGPGLIAFLPPPNSQDHNLRSKKSLDPEPVQKWAEEGFAVVGVIGSRQGNVQGALSTALNALVGREEVDIKDKVGVLVYDSQVLSYVLEAVSGDPRFVCVVSYGFHSSQCPVPLLSHVPNTDRDIHETTEATVCHKYATAGPLFVLPSAEEYHAGSASVSHTRSLVFLRQHLGGPHFDIEAIWEEHTYFEFEVRSVAKTMGTMVAEPYVNHVPTMAGGMGRRNLTLFYRDHFIFSNPADTIIEPVSRTIGADRVIDEFIFTMTHDKVVDWMLPGVPPSGRKIAIPMVAVVNVRGDRLYHEHIWWDQAGALKQVDAIPSHLPYPLPKEESTPASGPVSAGAPQGKRQLRLPVAGVEAARMLADETDGNSNEMFGEGWGVSDV